MMRRIITALRQDEDGAVTVDWILLTAGIVGFCITVLAVMENSTLGLSDAVAQEIDERDTF